MFNLAAASDDDHYVDMSSPVMMELKESIVLFLYKSKKYIHFYNWGVKNKM